MLHKCAFDLMVEKPVILSNYSETYGHCIFFSLYFFSLSKLEGTARYAGFTSRSCGGLPPPAGAFFALRAKIELFMMFWLTLGHFWCSVVTSVTLSSNLSNFEKNLKKIPKQSKKKIK